MPYWSGKAAPTGVPEWLSSLALTGVFPGSVRETSLECIRGPVGRFAPSVRTLVGRPGPPDPVQWHRRRLLERLAAANATDADRAAAQYHARWIVHFAVARPNDFRPRVSVVIPVRDRAREVREAVESCMDQTERPAEIIVVDDGSTDDPGAALAHFTEAVTLVRIPPSGAAVARNVGIGKASGEFLHLLDSDDRLDADALRMKIDAFGEIADAEVAYSAVRLASPAGVGVDRVLEDFEQPPTGDAGCPTRDLRAVVTAGRYPFLTSTVMAPRWLFLELGGFDPRLQRAEDSHLFFRMGLRGTKAIGLASCLTTRGIMPHRLSLVPPEGDVDSGLVTLLDLCAVIRAADTGCASSTFCRMSQPHRWPWIELSEDARIDAARDEVVNAARSLDQETARRFLLAANELPASKAGRFRGRLIDALAARGNRSVSGS